MSTQSSRLDKTLLNEAKKTGVKFSRSGPKQLEHWARLGQLMEQNPTLTYVEIHQLLLNQK